MFKQWGVSGSKKRGTAAQSSGKLGFELIKCNHENYVPVSFYFFCIYNLLHFYASSCFTCLKTRAEQLEACHAT